MLLLPFFLSYIQLQKTCSFLFGFRYILATVLTIDSLHLYYSFIKFKIRLFIVNVNPFIFKLLSFCLLTDIAYSEKHIVKSFKTGTKVLKHAINTFYTFIFWFQIHIQYREQILFFPVSNADTFCPFTDH